MYATSIVTLACLIVAGTEFAFAHSEISRVRASIATAPAVAAPVLPAAPRLTLAWQSSDETAAGTALAGGTVLTYSATTVTGRRADTGAPSWTYRRTDRGVCAVAQLAGRALIVFRHRGNCDQLQALDARTGAAVWGRTLDDGGQPVNGNVSLLVATDTLFIFTSQVIYAISVSQSSCDANQNCGQSFWVYSPTAGCRVDALAPGSAGVLIRQVCPAGAELVLRDRYQAPVLNDPRIIWTVPITAASPVAAQYVKQDAVIAAYDPVTGSLLRLDSATGNPLSASALTPPPAGPVLAQFAGDSQIITSADTAYGTHWTLPCTVLSIDPSNAAVAFALQAKEIMAVDTATGQVARTSALPAQPDRPAAITPVGSGYLLQGASTAVYRS